MKKARFLVPITEPYSVRKESGREQSKEVNQQGSVPYSSQSQQAEGQLGTGSRCREMASRSRNFRGFLISRQYQLAPRRAGRVGVALDLVGPFQADRRLQRCARQVSDSLDRDVRVEATVASES